MTRRRVGGVRLAVAFAGALWALAPVAYSASATRQPPQLPAQRNDLPAKLSDKEFWRLIDTFSEANGYFQSDNLVSNEDTFQYVIPELQRIIPPGGAYLGVGPDQNFTYLVALRPRIAFITDIRRGNLQEHLMYKALIELSSDRADFLSRLFSRKRPSGLASAATAPELFEAFLNVATSTALRDENLKAMLDQLGKQRGSSISDDDAAGMRTAVHEMTHVT